LKNKSISFFLLFFHLFVFHHIYGQALSWEWNKFTIGNFNSFGNDPQLIRDSNGNVIYYGALTGSATFGSTTLTIPSNGLGFYIVKYNASGNLLWGKAFGGNSSDYIRALTLDKNDNIYIAGVFQSSSLNIGAFTIHNPFSSGCVDQAFIAKFSPSGAVLLAKKIGDSDNLSINGIAVYKDKNILVTGGYFGDSIKIGNFTLMNQGLGTSDGFISKLDSGGNVLWARFIGHTSDDGANSCILDSLGDAYVLGGFSSAYMPLGNVNLINHSAESDIFIAKYNTNGIVLWSKSFGGTSYDQPRNFWLDRSQNIYVTGDFFSPQLYVGNDTLINENFSSVFIAKFSSNGNFLWSKTPAECMYCQLGQSATDENNDVYLTGSTKYELVWDSDTLTGSFYGAANIFVTKLDSNGNEIWSITPSGMYKGQGNAITCESASAIYLNGYFEGDLVLDKDTLVGPAINLLLNRAVFLAKLSSTVGIIELNNSTESVLVYPNPSNGEINIYSDELLKQVRLMSILGATLDEIKPESKKLTMRLNLAEGVYFITTITEKKGSSTKKIVIKN
jgi:hypothetical protein